MNINNWNGKKKVLAILAGLFVVVGLVVTVFLVQRVQELRGRAEKSTTISLTPPTQEVAPGDNATLDVILNPGVNQVNFVKLQINYDSSSFIDQDNLFELDPASGMRLVEQSTMITPGEIVITLDVGSDPTKVIRTTQRLGTINIQAMGDAKSGVKDVTIDASKTQVRSIQSGDAFNENVLANVSNATITISGGVCVENVATCTWGKAENAATYHYVVTDTQDDSVVEEGDVDSSVTGIEFPSEPGKTYKCEVIAKNECGESATSEGESTCEVPSVTPTPSTVQTGTPTPSKTGTPTPSKTGTPTPTASPTPTPTDKPTSTPTPTETPQNDTDTPTTPEGGVEEETPTFTPTPTTEIVVSTPIPTLPPTGNPLVVTGLIGGFLFLLGGLALLFL